MQVIDSRFVFPSSPGSVHASTVATDSEGSPVCALFCGTRESADDVDILVCRDENGAFGQPVRISVGDMPHWNPVLFSADGALNLWFKTGASPRSWRTMHCTSNDGVNWSDPVPLDCECPKLPTGYRLPTGPVKNKPILLPDGTLAAPASVEGEDGKWRCYVSYCRGNFGDGGSWHSSPLISVDGTDEAASSPRNAYGIIQPTLWYSHGLHFLARSTAGRLYKCDFAQKDGRVDFDGFTLTATEFPNNNSGVDLAAARGKLYLAANPVGENWGRRTPLTLSVSDAQDGEHFTHALTLEDGDGEFSYPAVISENDDILHITYTYNRVNVKYVKVKL